MAGFLLSDDSSYITGQALNVCGGLEMNQRPARGRTCCTAYGT
jgi:NAD(P)-dependent dehydrogenase (short-subunit alcohol dehydrogenase family)